MSVSLPSSELATPTAAAEDLLESAPQDVQRLAQLLSLEFEALKSRDLSAFEGLQQERTLVLERLALVAQSYAERTPAPPEWLELLPALAQCKQDHLRNIQLLQRQLQAVKGALQALQGESAASVDLYDRLGQVSRRQGGVSFYAA